MPAYVQDIVECVDAAGRSTHGEVKTTTPPTPPAIDSTSPMRAFASAAFHLQFVLGVLTMFVTGEWVHTSALTCKTLGAGVMQFRENLSMSTHAEYVDVRVWVAGKMWRRHSKTKWMFDFWYIRRSWESNEKTCDKSCAEKILVHIRRFGVR